MKRLVNVCLIVLATAFLTWRLNNANATRVGLAKTVPLDFAASIVDLTAGKDTLFIKLVKELKISRVPNSRVSGLLGYHKFGFRVHRVYA